MQTSAIAYRVADFLKQHPPFQYMDEQELVGLASRGRVKFHESDEYVCWQGSPHSPFIYVIQQGSVSLWDESVDPPTLRDIRGAGDSIGMERFNGSPTNLYSAKAASEVVLYALHAADFEKLLTTNARAAQYVASYSAVTADYLAAGERPRPHEIFLADLIRDRAPALCPASMPIKVAAAILNESNANAVALIDNGEVAAILTSADLLRWVADGASNPDQAARNIAGPVSITVAPQTRVSDCILAMAEANASAAALTTDGSRHTALQSIVTASALAPAFGDHPVPILQEIASAPSVEILRTLNLRARAWMLDNLSAPSALEWLAAWSDVVNRRILQRLLLLVGHDDPDTLFCFYGAAGRQELLTSVAPRIAVIGRAASSSLDIERAECGYLPHEPSFSASLDEWKARFSGWIRDPIHTQVYHSHPFFDLRPVHGPQHLFADLESHVRTELAAEPAFLRILAHDCLSSLPPLTFFRDLVVEESGEQTETFRLKQSALQPLADVARVFSLASGKPLGGSTREGFQRARRYLPSHESIFREAAETMTVMLYHQARVGLRMNSSGAELPLSTLSRQDRQVLKSGFRSIHNLLEFTALSDWLDTL